MKIFIKTSILVIVSVLVLCGCSNEPPGNTPRAKSHPREFLLQDISWVDPYAYMVDLEHPDTVQYMAREQLYLAEQTKPWRSKLKGMMSELNAQLSTERKTIPIVVGDFEYYSEIRKGHQYPVYFRRPKALPGDQQVVIDLNELSNGADFYALGDFSISPDQQTVAFTEDRTGHGNHTLRLRDLDSGVVTTIAERLEPNLAWNGDAVLAIERETNSVVEHRPSGRKVILYRETDPAFSLSVRTARDQETVIITSESHRATEIRFLSPGGELQLIAPRLEGHRYRLMIGADHMTVLSNYKRPGYAIALIQEGEVDPSNWEFYELQLPGSVRDFEYFEKHLLVQIRSRLRDELVLIEPETGFQRSVLTAEAGESFRLMQPDDGAEPGFQFRKRSLV